MRFGKGTLSALRREILSRPISAMGNLSQSRQALLFYDGVMPSAEYIRANSHLFQARAYVDAASALRAFNSNYMGGFLIHLPMIGIDAERESVEYDLMKGANVTVSVNAGASHSHTFVHRAGTPTWFALVGLDDMVQSYLSVDRANGPFTETNPDSNYCRAVTFSIGTVGDLGSNTDLEIQGGVLPELPSASYNPHLKVLNFKFKYELGLDVPNL